MGPWQLFFIIICVAGAACLGIMPFLLEYRVTARLLESAALNDAMTQIKNLQEVASQIGQATSQWNNVQESADKTAVASKQLVEQMTGEVRAFTEFMQRANDSEKASLRLEVEKLRRTESEWLQTLIRMLDHVYALHQGGLRSGQPRLIEQLSNFQNSCRDAGRRIGLVPFVAEKSETFDPQKHQLLEGDAVASAGQPVLETIAAGYLFQSKLVRPALVKLTDGISQPKRAVVPDEVPSAQNELPLESSVG